MEVSFEETMAPAKTSDPMTSLNIRLPQNQIEALESLAARKGIDRSVLIRAAIDRGLPALLADEAATLDYENKRLVNEKLKLSIASLRQEKESA